MPKFYETPEFLEAQREAYGRLAESGFKDLEIIDEKTGEPSRNMLRGLSPGDLTRGLYQPEKEEYYRQARIHLHRIKPGPERAIWRCYSEGMALARIHKHLGKRYELSPGAVRRSVKAQEARMFRCWRKDEEMRAAELRAAVELGRRRSQWDE